MTTPHQRITAARKLLGIFILCVLCVLCGKMAFGQMPPTNTVRMFTGPRVPVPVATNVVFSWNTYTNVWIEIYSSTNLASTNWTFYTNLPISSTQFVAPVAFPQQFFRQRVLINDVFSTN